MWNKPSDSERIDAVTAWLDAADTADHPVSIYHPEGEYLKGLVLYVE